MSAFMSAEKLAETKSNRNIVGINYQKYGANSSWNQAYNENQVLKIYNDFIKRISNQHDIIFICHNHEEVILAQTYFPEYKRFTPKTIGDSAHWLTTYLDVFVQDCTVLSLASLGIKSFLLGSDTRISTELFNIDSALLVKLRRKKSNIKSINYIQISQFLKKYKN